MTKFIPITLNDFENIFNIPNKKDLSKRAFNLISPINSESYYECILKENNVGLLIIKIYTSIAFDKNNARNVGEDAIILFKK